MLQQSAQIFLQIQVHATKEPLIDWKSEDIIKIGVFVLLVVSTLIIRAISPRAEHAIAFALITSIIVIVFSRLNNLS
jgi:hypothetical protein